VERPDQWIGACADGKAPVRDGTARINFRDLGEGLHCLGKIERMQHRQSAFEFLLCLLCARSLEQHSAELLALGLLWRGGVVVVSKDVGGTDAGKETYGK